MTYDADNRLLTYNGQTVEYDAEGNMTKGPLNGGMAEFSYDCRNRLVKVKEADGTVTTYEYDAENVRTAKVTGGVRTEYMTDRESTYSQVLVKKEYGKNIFGLYTEQKNAATYVYGTGLISERRDGGEKLYYHYNHLGSTMAVSDKGGNVVYRFVYDTYGELSDIQNANRISLQTAEEAQEYTLTELAEAAGIEYLYNGKYGVTTDGNGLYYMRARYYNQDIKRFINGDILSGDITNSQSMNRYCYVQGNPVSLTDPFGLCPTAEEIRKIELRRAVHTTLDVIGIFFDGADVLNGILYALEGDNVNAALCLVFFIPGVGSAVGLTVKYVFKIGGNAGEAIAKFVKKYAPELAENGGRLVSNVGGKLDDAGKWIKKKLSQLFGKGIKLEIDGSFITLDDPSDVWKLDPRTRGRAIEKILADTEYSDWWNCGAEYGGRFPTVDFQWDLEVVSLKSIDPSLPSYRNGKGTKKIMGYIDALNRNINIEGESVSRTLDVRIPKGTMGYLDVDKIQRYANEKNIIIKIGEF